MTYKLHMESNNTRYESVKQIKVHSTQIAHEHDMCLGMHLAHNMSEPVN